MISCGKATLMQDVAQLSTLSREIEAPSLSSSSAEKNPYINFKGVRSNWRYNRDRLYKMIACLIYHAFNQEFYNGCISVQFINSKIKSGLVEASLIDSERQFNQ
jgi:hypothetical protein